jgi:excisionase family DNA binding protein
MFLYVQQCVGPAARAARCWHFTQPSHITSDCTHISQLGQRVRAWLTYPHENETQRPALVAIAGAADYAEVSDRTIRRSIASNVITGYKLGPRCVRVDLNELDRALRKIPAAQ